MTSEEVVGTFKIMGTNQDAQASPYKGTLQITLDAYKRIKAVWTIGSNQIQTGTGYFKNNILVISFKYESASKTIFKGVVVYTCITPHILEGFWFEENGNPAYLGQERGFRKEVKTNLLN
ncbi:hypothetical protein ACFSQP_02390 [Bizionia sediminis]|uniref:Uncharacterized protein n=1 Tax=Bizionia sediminis TaxID=1737064 RepID=A0ABW5KPA4_9FLAO